MRQINLLEPTVQIRDRRVANRRAEDNHAWALALGAALGSVGTLVWCALIFG